MIIWLAVVRPMTLLVAGASMAMRGSLAVAVTSASSERLMPGAMIPPVYAPDAFTTSKVAVDAFGADVHDHLLNTARQEWAHFNRAVTDWERRRNFDQW